MTQHDIIFDRTLGTWSLLIDGLYHSQHETQVEAETAFDAFRAQQRKAKSVSLKLAELALAYGKSVAESRLDDAKQIKRQAMELQAAQHGVSYEVFLDEYRAYQGERKAA